MTQSRHLLQSEVSPTASLVYCLPPVLLAPPASVPAGTTIYLLNPVTSVSAFCSGLQALRTFNSAHAKHLWCTADVLWRQFNSPILCVDCSLREEVSYPNYELLYSQFNIISRSNCNPIVPEDSRGRNRPKNDQSSGNQLTVRCVLDVSTSWEEGTKPQLHPQQSQTADKGLGEVRLWEDSCLCGSFHNDPLT